MKRGLLLSAVAACGGNATPVSTGDPGVPAVDLPPPPAYAGLFSEGASWPLQVVTSANLTEPVTVTCAVTRYREADEMKWVEIGCGDGWPLDLGRDPLTGAWALSARGVWRIGELPEDGVPSLDDADVMIAAPPVAGTTPLDLPTDGPSVAKLEAKADGWCYSWTIGSVYNPSWGSMCVSPDGPTRGDWGFYGDDGNGHGASFHR